MSRLRTPLRARVRARSPGAARRDARRRRRGARRTGGRWSRSLAALGRAELRAALGEARRLIRENGVTYNVYGDPRGMRPAVGARPDPAADLAADEWARARGRRSRSARAARPRARRPLRAAAPAARRPAAARARVRATRASCAPCHGVRAARAAAACTSTPPTSRARPTAAGGCSATARRRRRARATRSRTGIVLSRALPEAFRECRVAAARRLLPRRCATRCARSRRSDRENPRIVLLTPGPVQRDLLRARLPRALPRLHARRGRRPHRARRARLPEDARRARAGRRDPAPPRRRLLRSARAARRLVARRRRAWCRRCAPATSRSRTRSAAGSSRSPALLRVPAGALPRAARRGARAAVGRDVVVRGAGRARLRASSTSTSW